MHDFIHKKICTFRSQVTKIDRSVLEHMSGKTYRDIKSDVQVAPYNYDEIW